MRKIKTIAPPSVENPPKAFTAAGGQQGERIIIKKIDNAFAGCPACVGFFLTNRCGIP